MSENFSNEEIEEIILDNKDFVESRVANLSLFTSKGSPIFSQLNSFNYIANKRDRIIRKAYHILAGLTWQQPFSDGNKETALSVTKLFLRRNGFDLPIRTLEDEKNFLIYL